jgi:hypothetical protein
MNTNKKILLAVVLCTLLLAFIIGQKRKYHIPKIIWCYWDSNTPKGIENIIDKNKKVLHDWEFRFLTSETIKKYINKSDFPKGYNELSIPAKSDYIRLFLLKKYGGCWIDASIIINDRNFIEDLLYKSIKNKCELTGCFFNGEIDKETQLRLNTPNLYIESWFIIAPKDGEIISLWFDEFSRAIKMGFLNYKKQIFKDGVNIIPEIYNKDDDNVYLTVHSCIQTVLQKRLNKFPNIQLINAKNTFFKLHTDCDWKCECMVEKYKNTSYINNIPVIKITGMYRGCLGI